MSDKLAIGLIKIRAAVAWQKASGTCLCRLILLERALPLSLASKYPATEGTEEGKGVGVDQSIRYQTLAAGASREYNWVPFYPCRVRPPTPTLQPARPSSSGY